MREQALADFAERERVRQVPAAAPPDDPKMAAFLAELREQLRGNPFGAGR